MFTKIDGAVIDRLEGFCHWFQRRTGRTNFFWVNTCVGANLMFIMGAALMSPPPLWPLVATVGSLDWLTVIANAWQHAKVQRYYEKGASVAHPFTLMWRCTVGYRVFAAAVLCFMCIGTGVVPFPWFLLRISLSYITAGMLMLAYMYFRCVVPLPPSAHRAFKEARERAKVLAAMHAHGQPIPERR